MKPITRKEKLIAGEELTPITREEMFLKKYGGGASSWNDLTDRPFYEERRILFDGEITIPDYGDEYSSNEEPYDLPEFIIGETYTVVFDGATYETEAKYAPDGTIIIGGLDTWWNYEESEFPFACGIYYFVATPGTHTVTIEGNFVKKMDSKYLPNDVCKITTFYPNGDGSGSQYLYTDASFEEKVTYNDLLAALNGIVRLNDGGCITTMTAINLYTDEGFARVDYWSSVNSDLEKSSAYTAEYERQK